MRKIMLGLAAVCIAMLLTSCGHNSFQYGDGVGFDFGVNPENWTASLTLRYGKILTAVTRDNVEIELTGNANADGSAGMETTAKTKIGTDGNLKIRVGRQINGAAVDLVKAVADADKVVSALSETDPPQKQ